MARNAIGEIFHFPCGFGDGSRAFQLAHARPKGESSLLQMIEHPQCPTIRLWQVSHFSPNPPCARHPSCGSQYSRLDSPSLGRLALAQLTTLCKPSSEMGKVVIETDLAVPVLLAVAGHSSS